MPAIWGRAPTRSIEEDKEVRLSTGAIIDLAGINLRLGREPSRKAIRDVVTRVQASMNHIVRLADLPDDESTKIMTSAQLRAVYGGRVFLDGNGNIVNRETRFSLFWIGGRLVPDFEDVN